MKTIKILLVAFMSFLLVACGEDGVAPPRPNGGGAGGVAATVPYTISGIASGASTGTTTVTLTPATGASTSVNTDSSGRYSFALPAIGNYTITPGNSNYSFSPSNATISIAADTTGRYGINFAASTANSISGTISGSALQGVTMLLYGAGSGAPVTTVSDAYGFYRFGGVSDGSYTVIPSLSGNTFSPANSVISVNSANRTGLNFAATAGGVTSTTSASLSGTISGAVKQNVLMQLYSTTSSVPVSTFTDVNGFFMFTGLSNGTYTVIPGLTGYSFSPNNTNITITGPNITANNYVSTAGSAVTTNNKLSGTVTGAIKQGVTIILHTPSGQRSAITDVNGYYEFTGLSNGSYTAIPTLSGYSFDIPSNVIEIASADALGNNYVANGNPATLTNSITGTFSGETKAGITVYLYGSSSGSTVSNATGYYEFTGLNDGTYTVIPSMAGMVFTPSNKIVALAGAINTANDFAGVLTQHNISGNIPGVAGVNLLITGASTATTTTDQYGNYTFTGLVNGTYVISPSLAQYTFNPTTITTVMASANKTGVNFEPTFIAIPTYKISGHITNRKGLRDNVITLSGASTATTLTDSNGYYEFTGLVAGSYTVTPSSAQPGMIYDPLESTVNLTGNTVLDFTGFDKIDVSVTTDKVNYDVKTALIAAGWDGVTKIDATITIASGVKLYGNSASAYGMYIQGIFPATSKVNIVNNGYILGYGGSGGAAVYVYYYDYAFIYPAGYPGGYGGNALLVSAATTVNISNFGTIAAGGGGGGSAGASYGSAGGGYGAGNSGSLVPSGNGGAFGIAGGNGAGYGYSGGGGAGGQPGIATVGAGNANWLVLGTVIGTQN
jgi:inhibitor of cysteine peptidase